MSDIPPKRSRFDLGDPGGPRSSRFDRSRSRSPAREVVDEARRSRSPVAKAASPAAPAPSIDAEAAKARALAAAAKINASLAGKKGIQHANAPPVRIAPVVVKDTTDPKDNVFQENGDFIKLIDINDLKVRYTLTQGDVQKKITAETGADVTTAGSYYPKREMATVENPALHLKITATAREALDKAVAVIEEMMSQDLPNLIDERRFRRNEPTFERDAQGRRKWPEDSVDIDLEPIPGFNLRATIVGNGGQNVKYIQTETGCRVQIKGQGSGFMEQDTGRESDRPMYLHITAPVQEQVDAAKQQCVELVEHVTEKYNAHKNGEVAADHSGHQGSYNRGGQEPHYRGGRGGGRDHGRRGNDRGGRDHEGYINSDAHTTSGWPTGPLDYDRTGQPDEAAQGGYNASEDRGTYQTGTTDYGYGVGNPAAPQQTGYDMTAAAAAAAGMDPQAYQAWVSYYATNPQADPYAGQGGFAAYMQNLAAYNQQYAAQGYPATTQGYPANSQPYGGLSQGYATTTVYHTSTPVFTAASPAQQHGYAPPAPPPPPPPGV